MDKDNSVQLMGSTPVPPSLVRVVRQCIREEIRTMAFTLLILSLLSVNSGILLVLTKNARSRKIPILLLMLNAVATPVLMFANVGPTWFISGCGLILAPTFVILIRDEMRVDRRQQPLVENTESKKWSVIGILGAIGFLIPGIAITTMAIASGFEQERVTETLISPEHSQPWKEGLTANVYWDKKPSLETRAGFEDTAKLLGVQFRHVSEVDEGNIRIWLDTKINGYCKLGTVAGFVSPTPIRGNKGQESGDIYLCRWTMRPDKFYQTDYSVMAHETAHLLAAVGHFGEGLMAPKGGDGSQWFSEEEIEHMCDRIKNFRETKGGEAKIGGKAKEANQDNGQNRVGLGPTETDSRVGKHCPTY